MKTNPKKGKSPNKLKKNVKKVSPKKTGQSNTIISMFKTQQNVSKRLGSIEKCDEEGKTQHKSPLSGSTKGDNPEEMTQTDSDDSDVTITKVEQKSPYFKTEGTDPSSDDIKTEKQKKLKLSLKKSVNRQKDISEEKHSTDNSESDHASVTVAHECVPSSSQKENSCDEIVQHRTSNRLSLSKRKSSSGDVFAKRKKISPEPSENSGKFYIEIPASCSNGQKTLKITTDDSEGGTGKQSAYQVKYSNMEHEESSTNMKKELSGVSFNKKDFHSVTTNFISHNLKQKSDVEIPSESHKAKSKLSLSNTHKKSKDDRDDQSAIAESDSNRSLTQASKSDSFASGTEEPTAKDDSVDEMDKTDEYRVPYYLENFRTLIKTVMEDEDNICLFNDDDMKYITGFNQLTESAQKLYVRIFSRKWSWLPVNKIKYAEIDEDISAVVEELETANYLLMSDSGLTDLEKTLNLLQAGDLKNLAKTYHMNKISQNKGDTIKELMKKSRQNTIGTMFQAKGLGGTSMMLNRAKQLLGRCFIQTEDPRNLFIRMLMLFSLPNTIIEDDANGGQNQLFQMLMVNMGKVVFPTYKVNKKTTLFASRSSLIRFSEASVMEHEMFTLLEKNNFNSAFDIYNKAVDKLETLSKDQDLKRFDNSLPVFLRPYTAGSVYVRILSQGVEILQRRRNYKDAVTLLHKLLNQECYCPNYRGRWWDRLALNYDAHLKDPVKALDVIKDGLNDSFVKTGHRLSLFQRAEKICTASGSKYKSRMKNFHHDKLLDLPQQTVEGTMLSDNVPGMRYKFMIKDPSGNGDADDVTFCGVEELVLQHYKQNGYPQGIHAEGSVVSNLFCLYFWDIIFKDIDDTFHSPFQTHPLDLYYGDFYTNRKVDIDDRITTLQNATEEELLQMMAEAWDNNYGITCVGMNWERFDSLQHAQGLVSCMKGPVLGGILDRYGQDPKNTRGGFPDLTLWNTETKTLKISEVKGPGDRLSHKQILWIDYLLKLGVDAEVCHVKGVGSKRLKPSTT